QPTLPARTRAHFGLLPGERSNGLGYCAGRLKPLRRILRQQAIENPGQLFGYVLLKLRQGPGPQHQVTYDFLSPARCGEWSASRQEKIERAPQAVEVRTSVKDVCIAKLFR